MRPLNYTHEQRQRLKILKSYCKKSQVVQPADENRLKRLSHVFINKDTGALYCAVPKVASSNLKRVFLKLDGKLQHVDDIKKRKIHHNSNLLTFKRFHKLDIEQIMSEFYKFLFVRHPFVRLVSAYRNKLYERNDFFNGFYGQRILRMYRKNMTEREYKKGAGVTFYEFVSWLIEKEAFDVHWTPVSWLCRPCMIEYDFVGEMDTLLVDAETVLKHLQVSHRLSFPNNGSDGHAISSKDLTKQYFKDLPDSMVDSLYDIYKEDFLMFGYNRTIE